MDSSTLQKTAFSPVHYVVWKALPGGAELSVRHYLDQFSPKRTLHAFSLRPTENVLYDGSKVNYHSGSPGQLGCYLAYFRYCRNYRKDIFHLMSVGPIILLLTLLAGVRKPVYHIHGTIYWKKPRQKWYLKPAWVISSWFGVHFIANSHHSANVFRRDVLPLTPEVIYNGFSLEPFLAERRTRTNLKRMGYAGRLQPGKNADLVIRLFEEIAGDHPELELHIAGDGALRPALEEQARKSPFSSRIFFHGWVEDVAGFYGSIDLFVFLSSYESFGNVLAEALLTGLPALTSNIPVFEEIYQGEKGFQLGLPDNYPELKERFLKAVSKYPQLAQRAFQLSNHLQKTFDIRKHLTEIEGLYLAIEQNGQKSPTGHPKAAK